MPDPSYDDPDTPNAFTNLRMVGIGVAPYSARGLTQTLTPIVQASQKKRTVNGVLRDISFPNFRKYASTITGADQETPNFDGKWPGLTVIVDCITELMYTTAGGTPGREVVPGSSRVSGNHTIYRPRITFMIANLSIQTDEYGAQTSWSLELEEV